MRWKLLILLTIDVSLVFLLTLIIDLLLIPCLSSAIILVLLLYTICLLLFSSLLVTTHCLLCLTDTWSMTFWYYRVIIIRVTLFFLRFFQVSRPHYRTSLLHFFHDRSVCCVFGALFLIFRLLGFFLWCDNLSFGI